MNAGVACLFWHSGISILLIKHDFTLKPTVGWTEYNKYEVNISCCFAPLYLRWEWAINLSITICMFFRFLGQKSSRLALLWRNTVCTRNLKKRNFPVNTIKTLLVCEIVCVSALSSHLYEGSTLLHHRCLKNPRCHDFQTEWKVSASPQSEVTYQKNITLNFPCDTIWNIAMCQDRHRCKLVNMDFKKCNILNISFANSSDQGHAFNP